MLAGCSPATSTFTTSSEPAPIVPTAPVPSSSAPAPSAASPSPTEVAPPAATPTPTQPAASPSASASGSPSYLFAPYFQTYTSDSLTDVAQASGVKNFTLAFLETTSKTGCALAWNGDKARPLTAGLYLPEIAELRAAGGDVIPSLGGWSADQGGTEIGDSCDNVHDILEAYKLLVTTYGVSRIDMDIEGRSLGRTAGIDRRNQAIRKLQEWAVAEERPLTISYTLPTSATGLEADALAVLQSAVATGVRIDVVQPMVFDYYDGKTTDMGAAAISALTGIHDQLRVLLPSKTDAELWAILGATIMPGIDDYPKQTEVTTLAHAQALRDFAAEQGMATLSMWAIQRDNGGCPGKAGSDGCSGIEQAPWAFSEILDTSTAP